MIDPTHKQIITTLTSLSVGEFVHVLHQVFEARAGDHDQRYFRGIYALATCHTVTFAKIGTVREISFVAYPDEPPAQDGLWESGNCSTCGSEAVSTNKRAVCAICGTTVSLT